MPTQHEPLVERITDAPVPPGWAMFRVAGVPLAMPAPAPDAPYEFRKRYLARVIATGTGLCPMCNRTAGLSHDPETSPAAFRVLAVTYGITHDPDCPAIFTDADRQFFDPRAVSA